MNNKTHSQDKVSRSPKKNDLYPELLRSKLEKAGIPKQVIRVEYNVSPLWGVYFHADVAIVENEQVKAIFEVKQYRHDSPLKPSIKAFIIHKARFLFTRIRQVIKKSIPCYLVIFDGQEISEIKELLDDNNTLREWPTFENLASELHDRLQLKRETLDTISKYLDAVRQARKKLDSENKTDDNSPKDNKRSFKFFYRGQSNESYSLTPSLFRNFHKDESELNGKDSKFGAEWQTYYPEEKYLIQEARRVFPNAYSQCQTDLDRMAVSQHHGIPTRLLDVTGNALVALYFASKGSANVNGTVFVFRANVHDFRSASDDGQSNKFQLEQFHKKTARKIAPKPILVTPTFRTSRQTAQDGSFYLFGNDSDPFRVKEFDQKDYVKITIPKDAKPNLLRQLREDCNIHRGTLFPELLSDYRDTLVGDAEDRINCSAIAMMQKDS